jgi:hypothetical protein
MKHELIHNFNTNNKFNTSLMESLRILLKFANVHLEICFIVITYCIKICIQKSNHIMVLLIGFYARNTMIFSLILLNK